MNNYVIFTDTCCDLSSEKLLSWGIESIELKFRRKDETVILSSAEMTVSEFFKTMREGTVFQTSMVNPDEYREAYRRILNRGLDLFVLCLSSGISGTYNAAKLAAEDLAPEFPNREIIVVDSLCASAGQGLLLYLAAAKRDAGATLKELRTYVSETAPKICHWFTVDDLQYLKRGGRITAAEAFAATVLDIKPVMHMNSSGQLKPVSKVRGRRHAIKELMEKYQLFAEDPEKEPYFISHGDCLEDARLLEKMICQRFGQKAECITEIGPVVGSHSGPGTLALFFLGRQR